MRPAALTALAVAEERTSSLGCYSAAGNGEYLPAPEATAAIRKTLSAAPFENPINTRIGLSLIRYTEIS
jgi:hypothetical protein